MQVVITIEGSQADVFEQEPDELVQFSTDGEYTCVDGCGVLTYPERELTGSTVGLETQRYRSTLGERGGVLDLLYVVDFDHACANRNQLKITVREQ